MPSASTATQDALETLRSEGLHAKPSKAFPGGIEGGTSVVDLGGGWEGWSEAFFVVPNADGGIDVTVTGPGNGSHRVAAPSFPEAVREVVAAYARRRARDRSVR